MNSIGSLKGRMVFMGWVLGLLVFTSLLWILTQPLQAQNLSRSVNNVLSNNGDSRRVGANIAGNGKTGLLGYWYSMHNSADKMFVFAVFQDGILCPLGAVVSADGDVREIIPMSAHAAQVFDNLPQSILQMYVMRIESQAGAEGRKR